jgi:hypothetical protein
MEEKRCGNCGYGSVYRSSENNWSRRVSCGTLGIKQGKIPRYVVLGIAHDQLMRCSRACGLWKQKVPNSVLLRTFLDDLDRNSWFDLDKFRKYAKRINGSAVSELTIKDVADAGSLVRLKDRKRPIGKEWVPITDSGKTKKE